MAKRLNIGDIVYETLDGGSVKGRIIMVHKRTCIVRLDFAHMGVIQQFADVMFHYQSLTKVS